MNGIELSEEQEGILSFIQTRRPDLHGGVTVEMIASARRQDTAEVEVHVQELIDAGMLEVAAPGAGTYAPNGETCYGPTKAGLAWLHERKKKDDADMVAMLRNLTPPGYR